MPRAVLQPRGGAESLFEVPRPRTIGGGPGDDVRVEDLPGAALRVAPAAGGLLVESREPFTVGGRLVAPGVLRFLRRGERAEADAWTIRPDPDERDPDGTRALVGAALAGWAVVTLGGPGVRVLEGAAAGRLMEIAPAVVVGRGGGADLVLADPLSSRRHVALELRRGEAFARDLRSKNGFTLLRRAGGEPVHVGRGRRVRLAPGDELQLGRTLLRYEAGPERPQAPRAQPARERRLAGRAAMLLASAGLLGAAALLWRAAG